MGPLLNLNIPPRPVDAPTGTELVAQLVASGAGYSRQRDDLIYAQVASGNVPDFMRLLCPVEVSPGTTVYVAPDYLCVGSDDDFVHVPLNPMTFQRVCDAFGAVIPTRKMVDATWKAATAKLQPMPMGPPQYQYDNTMQDTSRFAVHSRWCQDSFKKGGHKLGELTAGHKKDVVVCRSVQDPAEKKVAIYGWHKLDGRPIQGPQIQDSAHEITYRDYSHGERLVAAYAVQDGATVLVASVLKDPLRAGCLSDEVPPIIGNPRYVTSA